MDDLIFLILNKPLSQSPGEDPGGKMPQNRDVFVRDSSQVNFEYLQKVNVNFFFPEWCPSNFNFSLFSKHLHTTDFMSDATNGLSDMF